MPKVLDRDLLIFFRTLCKTCNLAAAANSLGIPAATASRMLGKLREAFGDELFTRTATGLVPNWRAQRAVPHVQTLLEEYELLLEDKVFTPAELTRTFRIACADHGTHFLAPGIALITQVAPLAQVEVWDLTDRWTEELKNGDIDAVVSPMSNVPEDCHAQALCSNVPVKAVVRPGHPLEKLLEEKGRITPQDVMKYGFVDVVYQPSDFYRENQQNPCDVLADRRIAVRVPFFFGAARIVVASNLVTLMSDVMCEWFLPQGLLHALPLKELDDCEHRFTARLIWHDRSHADPAMQWVRSVILESCREHFRSAAPQV